MAQEVIQENVFNNDVYLKLSIRDPLRVLMRSLSASTLPSFMSSVFVQRVVPPPRSNPYKIYLVIVYNESNHVRMDVGCHVTFQSIGFFPAAINASFTRLKHRDVRNGAADFVAPSGEG